LTLKIDQLQIRMEGESSTGVYLTSLMRHDLTKSVEDNSFAPVPRAEFGFIDDAPVALLFHG